ncbi:MAG: nitrilase-related carbon-nitrogen hydrolase, partial [Brevinematales bacterium]
AKFYNSGIFISNGEVKFQGKERLVPFGEYVPFRRSIQKVFPHFFRKELLRGDFSSSKEGRKIFKIRGKRFSIFICWEILFGVPKDIDFVVNISNDVWFSRSRWGEEQHFWYSVFRATEAGVWLIRSTNFGISAIVSPSGKIVTKKDRGEGFVYQTRSK